MFENLKPCLLVLDVVSRHGLILKSENKRHARYYEMIYIRCLLEHVCVLCMFTMAFILI